MINLLKAWKALSCLGEKGIKEVRCDYKILEIVEG